MNKIFKVIWNEARNAYVVVSEIAKNHGSKSCSTKKLLAMLIATGVMTCASFDVLAAEPAAKETNKSQYVAFKDDSPLLYDGKVKKFGGYNYIYDATNQYWVREGYVLTVDENGGKYTPLSQKDVRVEEYNKNLAKLVENDDALNRNDIKEVTLTKDTNSAIIGLVRNGGKAVDGAITVTSGGGTDGNDTFVKISNAADTKGKTFATGSKVEVKGPKNAITGIKCNGVEYAINNKVYTAGANVNIDKNNVISATDTTYTAGNGIAISGENHAIAVKLKEGENNLEVTEAGLELKKALTVNSVAAGDIIVNTNGLTIGTGDKGIVLSTTNVSMGGQQIHNVAKGTNDNDAVNVAQLKKVSEAAASASQGWKLKTTGGTESVVAPGATVEFDGDDNIQVGNVGNKVSVTLKKQLTGIQSIIGAGEGAGSISFANDGIKFNNKVTIDNTGKITGVAAGVADTDAVNVGQLNAAVQAGNTDTHIKAGEYGVGTDNKVNMQLVDKNGKDTGTVTITDVAKASDVGNVNDIADDLKNGGEGKTTVVEAVNNLNNKLDTKVGDLQYSKVEKGDIADGDSTTTAIGKLDQKLTDVAATAAKHTKVEGGNNITVTNTAKEGEAANYKVELNNDIDVNTVKANSVTTGQTVMDKDGLKVGDKVSVTATAVKVGDTTITDKGLEIKDGPSVTKDGINAGNKKVTGVADGDVKENSKDAINGGQLHQVKADINNRINGVENQVISNSNRINQLGNRVNKVGAGAAALAALHPMDFDPDDKLTFSAGYGNYGGENAAAIGAYYRPDEKVMFSVGGTVGNGENMVNAGVSFALDRTNHVSNSRTALAREVIDLRGQLAVMGAKMAKMEKALGMLDETKTKLFPDIPANHWAYEYIAKLAGNGYIEGYPDGNFGGDRLMTRYEFAAMLYRAIENGAALEEKIIKEFEPELGRIRVDRISGEDGDRDKIERVRVNDTKGERDHYGNKLAK